MKASEILYKAATKMRAGFSAEWEKDGCGCFAARVSAAAGATLDDEYRAARRYLDDVVGLGGLFPYARVLRAAGWKGKRSTNDAVAALEIAADIAAAEGD